MKTLTEFSGTMIRMAARAESDARKTIPQELLSVNPGRTPTGGVTAKPDENADVPAQPPANHRRHRIVLPRGRPAPARH